MENLYKVIFTGELLPGVDKGQAIEQFSLLFKIPKEKSEDLISSATKKVIKSNIPLDVANRYQEKLRKAGLEVQLMKIDPPQPPSLPEEKKGKESGVDSKKERVKNNKTLESPPNKPQNTHTKKVSDQMGLLELTVRFTLIFIFLNIIIGVLSNLIGFKGNAGVEVVVILTAVAFSCTWFAKKNDRYLTKKEQIRATVYFSFINLVFKLSLTAIIFIALSQHITPKTWLLIISMLIVVHTPLIYLSISSNRKRMLKRGEIPS